MTDWKLQQVPLASFNYRHEAEFAAGFLRDAGIPYRLQIEDPTLGLSATNSATIWVSAGDQKRAQKVLDHDLFVGEEDDDAWADYAEAEGEAFPEDAQPRRALESVTAAGPVARRTPARPAHARGSAMSKTASDLTLRSRMISLVGAAGAAAGLFVDAVRQSPMMWWAVAIVAVVLTLAGLMGRAPGPLRGILQALSGEAP